MFFHIFFVEFSFVVSQNITEKNLNLKVNQRYYNIERCTEEKPKNSQIFKNSEIMQLKRGRLPPLIISGNMSNLH